MFRKDVNEMLGIPDLASAVAVNCWSGSSFSGCRINRYSTWSEMRMTSVFLERPCISPSTMPGEKEEEQSIEVFQSEYFHCVVHMALRLIGWTMQLRVPVALRETEIEKFVSRREKWMFSIPSVNEYHKVSTIERWRLFFSLWWNGKSWPEEQKSLFCDFLFSTSDV